ncbi:hypothetical protein VPHD81_0126 [Vibrio phage D81]
MLEMELFKQEVEMRLDSSDEKLERMAGSVELMATSVNQLVERDIRNQERENRQLDFNSRVMVRVENVESKQQEILQKLGIGLFKLGLIWSAGGIAFTIIVTLAIAYLKTQGIDLKP